MAQQLVGSGDQHIGTRGMRAVVAPVQIHFKQQVGDGVDRGFQVLLRGQDFAGALRDQGFDGVINADANQYDSRLIGASGPAAVQAPLGRASVRSTGSTKACTFQAWMRWCSPVSGTLRHNS